MPPDGDRPSRRHVVRNAFWMAALAAGGVLPAACGRPTWSLAPPRPVGWTMKPLSSARVEERPLPDGRIELHVEHEPLRGVTPEMLVWWWRNLDGTLELNGRPYPRYLIWHPVDHIHFALLARAPDGSTGPGAVFHIVEALGADLRFLADARLHLKRLDETGAAVEVYAAGLTVLRIEGRFLRVPEGTKVSTTMTAGNGGWLGRAGLNWLIAERFLPGPMRKAWLKHSVEEIGNLEFFLPQLYRKHVHNARAAHSA